MNNDAPPASSGQTEPAPASSGATGFAVFRHRDYRLFFFGKFFALCSTFMLTVALGYQIYDLTGDPMHLALIGLTIASPSFIFLILTGYVADRYERRRVLSVCYLVMMVAALIFCVLTFMKVPVLWPIYAALFLLGTGRAFYSPASSAVVANLVPIELLPNAIAWNTSSSTTALICGPGVGGLLYLLGPEVVYGTAAVTFLIGAITMSLISARNIRGHRGLNLESLLAGLVFVFKKKIILGSIVVDLFVVLTGGVVALLPIFAKDILDVGPAGAGALRSAMAAGGLVAALALTRIPVKRKAGAIMFFTVGIFGLSIILFGLSTWFWLSIVAMFIMGASDMISVFIRGTLLQIATPDEMRGRVGAINSVFVIASNDIGDFRAGLFASFMGAVPAVLCGGVGAVLIAGICWKLFPDLARFDRLDRAV